MQDKGPNFSTWGPYAIAGTFQGVLLLLCLYFTYLRPGRLALQTPEGSTAALQQQDSDPALSSLPERSSFSSLDSSTSLQGSTGPLLQPVDTAHTTSHNRAASPVTLRTSPHLKKEHH